MNLESMTTAELKALRSKVDDAIAARREEDIVAMRAEIERMVAAKGFSLGEVLNKKSSAQAKSPSATKKYVHPKNPELIWLGKGVRPKWLREYLDGGGKIEDCLVA